MTEREYNECVQQFADNVYRFILKNLRHQEDARDVVQSAFEKLWVNRDVVQIEKSKSYLFTIAYNQMIDFIRKQKSFKNIIIGFDNIDNLKLLFKKTVNKKFINFHIKKKIDKALIDPRKWKIK
jgi:RNA polymerase sigma factor (sigma-70 family)